MEWLQDKKNLPIVIGLVVFVILIAGGVVIHSMGSSNGGVNSQTVPPASYPGGHH